MSKVKKEPQKYSLFYKKPEQNHHIMRIQEPKDVQMQDKVHLYRKPEEIPDQDEEEIRIGGEVYDKSKAVSSKKLFKKKAKTLFLERDHGYDKDDGIRGLGKQIEKDPDVEPLVLETGGKQYEGKVEGAQSSNYNNGFDVIPAKKWYKFNAVNTYHTLTIDEAEEKLKVRGGLKQSDRWIMHQKLADIKTESADVKVEDGSGISSFRVTDTIDATGKVRKFKRVQEEELDFEEDFQDDDGLVDLGIEDEQDRKDALSRTFGGSKTKNLINFEDVDDESLRSKVKSKNERKMQKTLEKIEKKDLWDSDEDRDPYASDESSEDLEEEVAKILNSKEPVVKLEPEPMDISDGSGAQSSPTPATTSVGGVKRKNEAISSEASGSKKQKRRESAILKSADSKPASPSGASADSAKVRHILTPLKIRLKLGGSSSTGTPPPPPSAARVIAEEKERRRAQKRSSLSPAYSPQGSSTSPSPEPAETKGIHGRVLGVIVKTLQENGGALPVAPLVDAVKPLFVTSEEKKEMKSVIKSVMKKVASTDKKSGVITLKSQYR